MALPLPPLLHHVSPTLPSSLPPRPRPLMSRSRSRIPLPLLWRYPQLSGLDRRNYDSKKTKTESSCRERNVYRFDRRGRVVVGKLCVPQTTHLWNAWVDGGSSESEKDFIELDSREFPFTVPVLHFDESRVLTRDLVHPRTALCKVMHFCFG